MWRLGRYSERNKRKSSFTTTPLSFDAHFPANPHEYPHKSYLGYIFAADTMGLSCTVSEIRWFIGRKSPVRTHPSLRNCTHSGWPLSNFVMNQIFLETRMFRLSGGEEIMTLAYVVLKPDASKSADRHRRTPDTADWPQRQTQWPATAASHFPVPS